MTGTIAVAELIDHGLAPQPTYVAGVRLPSVDAVLCRRHVDRSTLRLGVQPADDAVLLVGDPGTEKDLGVWCAVCRAGAEGPE